MYTLKLENVSKSFKQANGTSIILSHVSFHINAGEICCLVGPSGCGKTTLLQIAGLLDTPTHGKVFIDGQDCSRLNDVQTTEIRGKKVGFIYQFHHLLDEFSAIENVMMPLLIAGISKTIAAQQAKNLMAEFNLSHRLNNLPTELSGGERQRTAIVRGLIHQPKLLFADEPTGNLDPQNAEKIFDEFLKLAKEKQVAVMIVTHNLELAKKADRILTIVNGKVL